MWFVTPRREIVSILRDASRFTTEAERSTIRDIFGAHMMTTDGDVALGYKRSCLHAFRADALAREMGTWVNERARLLVDTAVSDGRAPDAGFDLMDEVATPLAVGSALRVLGLPELLGAAGWSRGPQTSSKSMKTAANTCRSFRKRSRSVMPCRRKSARPWVPAKRTGPNS